MADSNQGKESNMSKNELILKVGQTITTAIMTQAEQAGLPVAALAELWPKRTLNKRAITIIETAIKKAAKKGQAEKKESK